MALPAEAARRNNAADECTFKSDQVTGRKRQWNRDKLALSSPHLSSEPHCHSAQVSPSPEQPPHSNVAAQLNRVDAGHPQENTIKIASGELNIEHQVILAINSPDNFNILSQGMRDASQHFAVHTGATPRSKHRNGVYELLKTGVQRVEPTGRKVEVPQLTQDQSEISVARCSPLESVWEVTGNEAYQLAFFSEAEIVKYLLEARVPISNPHLSSFKSYLTWLGWRLIEKHSGIVPVFQRILDFHAAASERPPASHSFLYMQYFGSYSGPYRFKLLPRIGKSGASKFLSIVRDIDTSSGSRRVKLLGLSQQFEQFLSEISFTLKEVGLAAGRSTPRTGWIQTIARITLVVINRIILTYATLTTFEERVIMAVRQELCDFLLESRGLWRVFLGTRPRNRPQVSTTPDFPHLLPLQEIENLNESLKRKSFRYTERKASTAVWSGWFLKRHSRPFAGLKEKNVKEGFSTFLADCSLLNWIGLHRHLFNDQSSVDKPS